MPKTIFFAPDLHKRDVDFNSIKGYREALDCVQEDILEHLQTLSDGMLVSMGDWYDKGYRSTGRVFSDAYYDREISRAVNGEAYICLGNHFFLERDSNPEMFMIQPSYLYTPREQVPMKEPIFRTTPYVVVGGVQISFFHFNKTDKNYVQPLAPGVKYHIGVYHDDCVLPSDIRAAAGYYGTTSNEYLNNIYSNVDLAICGHIHVAVGTRTLTLTSGKTVPLVVPGALAITENKEAVKHKTVDCPQVTINDDGTFNLGFVTMSTHMEKLKFYKVTEQKVSDSLEIMGNGDSQFVTPNAVSLVDFLERKGYSERDIRVLSSVGPESDVYSVLTKIREEYINADAGSEY